MRMLPLLALAMPGPRPPPPGRQLLAAQVERYPGLHLRELARNANLDVPLAKYHLDRLVKGGVVSERRTSGFVRYFPRGEGQVGTQELFDPRQKHWLALLRRPVPLHAVAVLLEQGASTPEELCRRIDVAHGTLHYHLRRMESRGLIVSQRLGRQRLVRLADAPAVQQLLLRCRPPDTLVQGFLETWDGLGL